MDLSPHMILRTGVFGTTGAYVILFFSLVSLTSGCGSDEVKEAIVVTEPEEQPPTVREWYPTSKNQQQAPVYVSASAMQPQYTVVSPLQPANMGQHPWAVAPQPGYAAPQVVYQTPQLLAPAQQPSVWSIPTPATVQQRAYWSQTPTQYQAPPQPPVYYQYVPRPWGNPTAPADPTRPAVTTNAWPQEGYPQGSYMVPWAAPVTGGQPLVSPNYGYVW